MKFVESKPTRTFQFWDNRKFVETWMKSDTVEDVAHKLGRSVSATSQKASTLRSRGVHLPKKLGHRSDSVESLNKLIAKLGK